MIQVEDILSNYIQSDIPILQEVKNHLQKSVGKRLRPIFLLLISNLFPCQREDRTTVAAAIEMVHIATLIHDDCIDQAEKRRNLPTIFSVWGTQTAILAGDYLYSSVIKNLLERSLYDVLDSIGKAVMTATCGELRQISQKYNFEATEDEYFISIYEKTAALFEAVCRSGGIMGNATPDEQNILVTFGKNLGISFQIIDDLLDYIGDSEKTGKPVGMDLAEGKVTLPLIYALQQATPKQKKNILPILRQYENRAEEWDHILDFVRTTGGLDYARKRANEYVNASKEILFQFSPSPIRDILNKAVEYVVLRNR